MRWLIRSWRRLCGRRRAERFATLPWDGVRWEFAAGTGPVVAVGDVQGDLVGLCAILRQLGLIDGGGRWSGGRRRLVLLGDLVGGHEDSRLLVPFVMRLEREAARAGGAVHALLGNHDVLPAQGDVRRWTRRERLLFRRHPVAGAPGPSAREAFRGDSECARWLRRRNAIVRIGETLFVHAGVGPWLAATDPGDVNATVRAWIAHWQGRAAPPPPRTRWAAGVPDMPRGSRFARGPLWTRAFKPEPEPGHRAPSRQQVEAWLDRARVRRVVVGHAPVDGGILLEHPRYGDRVVMADTRISDRELGRLSALRIEGGRVQALTFADRHRDLDVRRREKRALAAAGADSPWWTRLRRRRQGRRQPQSAQ